jgi:hypothetical protein
VPLFTFEDNLEYTNQQALGEHALSLVHTGKVICSKVAEEYTLLPFTLKK